jgi:hypothetical protein
MRRIWQRIIGWTAIYAIVLQAFSVGLIPQASAQTSGFDPLVIICQTDASGTAATPDSGTGSHISHGCDHCVLCSATTPPPAPDSAIKISFDAPASSFSWPSTKLPARDTLRILPELPTGPPQAN